MASPVVSVVDVSSSIWTPDTQAVLLAPVTVDLHPGTLVAVSGPSGSGKTTLCNIVIGWERGDTGSVRWADDAAQRWARLAVAPQRLALLHSLDIRESLASLFWSSGIDVPEAEFDALTRALDLDALLRRGPSEVSFGEQQRAAIARALLGSPRLAVLDEPTGHQGEARATLVIDAMVAAKSNGTCVLEATHDSDIIAAADELLPPRPSSSSSP